MQMGQIVYFLFMDKLQKIFSQQNAFTIFVLRKKLSVCCMGNW